MGGALNCCGWLAGWLCEATAPAARPDARCAASRRDVDCHDPESCCGNRLEALAGDPEGRKWGIKWPHHKNEERWAGQGYWAQFWYCSGAVPGLFLPCCFTVVFPRALHPPPPHFHSLERRWGRRAIKFKVPKEAEPALDRYLEARALLARPDNPFLLVTATGLPYDLSNFNQRWSSILGSWQAPAKFSPQARSAGCRLLHV